MPSYETDYPMNDNENSPDGEVAELPASSNGYSTQDEDVAITHNARTAKRKANDNEASGRPSTVRKKMRMSSGGRMPRAVPPLEPLPEKTTASPRP